ncbi:MAG: hypothetical protein JWN45_1638 [Acidobacteriaceae bacterium]|jgi:hypothetical protein|nr:hypothetical protein [Acidobacteriaceae bacterium]
MCHWVSPFSDENMLKAAGQRESLFVCARNYITRHSYLRMVTIDHYLL